MKYILLNEIKLTIAYYVYFKLANKILLYNQKKKKIKTISIRTYHITSKNNVFHHIKRYKHYQLPKINKIKIVCDLNYCWMDGNYLAFALAQNKAIAHV